MQTNLFDAMPRAWQKPDFFVIAGTLADDVRDDLLSDLFQQIEQDLDEFRDDFFLADNSEYLCDYECIVNEMSFRYDCHYGDRLWSSLSDIVAAELDISSDDITSAAGFSGDVEAIDAMLLYMDESMMDSSDCEVSSQYCYYYIPDWTVNANSLGEAYVGSIDSLKKSYPALNGINDDEIVELIEDKTGYHCFDGDIYQDLHGYQAVWTLGCHAIESLTDWITDRVQR